MIPLKWNLIYLIIFILADFTMASSDARIDKKVTELFEINWESMRYNKTVTQYNPEVISNRQPSRADENLTLNCRVEVKDPNFVLGISRKGFLTEMTDIKKRNIEINQQEPKSRRSPMPPMDMWYEGLRYERLFTQPPKIPRWRLLLYKYLRIQPKPFRPELIYELQPSRLQFDLDLGLLDASGGEIRNLKGYYYALVAESVEHVEVPFEPNDQ